MKWVQCEVTKDAKTKTVEYAVNKYSEGLFKRGRDGSWKQITGTGQFSAKTPKDLMRKIRAAYYQWDHEKIRMVRGSAVGWED